MFMLLQSCNYEYVRRIEGWRLGQYEWLIVNSGERGSLSYDNKAS